MSTIDKIEVEKFSKIASDWWNPNGKFKPLHVFNPARIKLIKEKIISYFSLDPNSKKPLSKISILDIGCGGGLLCEPLKRLGAEITGIDASENNIKAAKLHAEEMGLDIKYINCSPENLKADKKFKVILNPAPYTISFCKFYMKSSIIDVIGSNIEFDCINIRDVTIYTTSNTVYSNNNFFSLMQVRRGDKVEFIFDIDNKIVSIEKISN